MTIAPAAARDEDLIFEYERLRVVALASGTSYGLAPGERLLLSDGLHHWAIGWKSSRQRAAVTIYQNRSGTVLGASPFEKPQSSIVDLIASMTINSITQMRRLHYVR